MSDERRVDVPDIAGSPTCGLPSHLDFGRASLRRAGYFGLAEVRLPPAPDPRRAAGASAGLFPTPCRVIAPACVSVRPVLRGFGRFHIAGRTSVVVRWRELQARRPAAAALGGGLVGARAGAPAWCPPRTVTLHAGRALGWGGGCCRLASVRLPRSLEVTWGPVLAHRPGTNHIPRRARGGFFSRWRWGREQGPRGAGCSRGGGGGRVRQVSHGTLDERRVAVAGVAGSPACGCRAPWRFGRGRCWRTGLVPTRYRVVRGAGSSRGGGG